MHVSVTIQLANDQTISNTPSELADEILRACEGDPAVDFCSVYVQSPVEPGTAGTPPEGYGAA
jgi:hypothetical protein